MRGADLLEATHRQIHLQRLLALTQPRYLHVPVVAGPDGAKLSKQTHAQPANRINPAAELCDALSFLGQDPPQELRRSSPNEVLRWAVAAWNPAAIPATLSRVRA